MWHAGCIISCGSMSRIATLAALVSIAMPLPAQMGMGRGGCCRNQASSQAPVALNPVVEISGVVGRMQISPNQEMPYLELKRGKEITKVYLGPIHYLIAENFNPKTGQKVTVKGYKQADSVIASQVILNHEEKTLVLRDNNGWPLWQSGPWAPGRGRMMGGPPPPRD